MPGFDIASLNFDARGLIPAMFGSGSPPVSASPYNTVPTTPVRVNVQPVTTPAPVRTPATTTTNQTYIAPMSVNDILKQ